MPSGEVAGHELAADGSEAGESTEYDWYFFAAKFVNVALDGDYSDGVAGEASSRSTV